MKLEAITQQIEITQARKEKKTYTIQEICPFPFDQSITTIPFPKNFEIPKFDNKYKARGSLIEHIHNFSISCMEVQHNDSYLMRLFPRSPIGHAMEWFTHLTLAIKTFDELSNKFISHFSFNIEQDFTITNLSTIKQNQGESFTSYLQRWRQNASRCKWPIPDKELVDIFITNILPEINY